MKPEADISLERSDLHQVVIVDSDTMIIDLIKYNLENDGYVVTSCATAEQALESDFSLTDLIITEVVLGEINGLMLAGMLKSNPDTADIPLIICTTLDSEDDIVKGFEAGADDYILKPFSLRELMARIKSVLRRRNMAPARARRPGHDPRRAVSIKGLSVDPGSRSVTIDGRLTALTRTEIQLLHTLISHPGHFFNQSDLYRLIWNKEYDGASRALDVSVSRLRKKLGPYAANIVNRSGIGYGFVES